MERSSPSPNKKTCEFADFKNNVFQTGPKLNNGFTQQCETINIHSSIVVEFFGLKATLEEKTAWAYTIHEEIVAKNKELAIAKQKESK